LNSDISKLLGEAEVVWVKPDENNNQTGIVAVELTSNGKKIRLD
jgi:Tfp pilus assembly protein PilZ